MAAETTRIEVGLSRAMRAVLAGSLKMDPEVHIPLAGSWAWLSWLRNEHPNLDLFLYGHAERGSFVLADWVFREGEDEFPVCTELEVLVAPPTRLWPFDLDPVVMRARLAGASVQAERIRAASREEQAQRRKRAEHNEFARTDLVDHYHRKGKEQVVESIKEPGTYRAMEAEPTAVRETRFEVLEQMKKGAS